ncbi:MAG: hypothetical protein FJZ56_07295, partial [Chlamydiae bacterium]|nr:hypothetical protein [Chlamydiota bacterium]
MKERIYYVNGKYVSPSDAKISVDDSALSRAYAATETLRTYHGKLFRLEDHLIRLQKSLDKFSIPFSSQSLAGVFKTLVEKNHGGDLSFKIIITGGLEDDANEEAKKPAVIIKVKEIASKKADIYEKGAQVITTKLERVLPQYYSTMYLPAILARMEAKAKN